MKWEVERKTLLTSLMGAEMVVQEKMGFSISSSVQIHAKPEGVSILANNGEMTYHETPAGEVVNTGSVCVSHARILGIVKEMPEGKLELFVDENLTLHVSPFEDSRKLEFNIKGISAESFPALPTPQDGSIYIGVEKTFFKRMIHAVSFAVAAQPSKYSLNGIFMECKSKKLALVASDGRRLAVAKMFLTDNTEDFSVILPHSFMVGLSRLLEGDGLLGMNYSSEEGRMYFNLGSISVSTSLVGGEYPAYEEFLPTTSEKQFFVKTAEIAKAVRVGTLLFDAGATPQIIFDLKPNVLTLTSEEKKNGMSKESVAVEYEDKPTKIAFNAKLLNEIIRVFEGEMVEFGISESEAPAIIKEKSSSDFLYVLMPMRMAESTSKAVADVDVATG